MMKKHPPMHGGFRMDRSGRPAPDLKHSLMTLRRLMALVLKHDRFRFFFAELFRVGVIGVSADIFVDVADAFKADDFRGDVIEKISVMAYGDDRAVVFGEKVR